MRRWAAMLALIAIAGCGPTRQAALRHVVLPEQRTIDVSDAAKLPPQPIPENVAPRTVTNDKAREEWRLSLDDAVKIALENAKVIRVLAGVTAVSSGKTIYDPAITNTTIDQEQARFDPVLSEKLRFNRTETAAPFVNPADPRRSFIVGTHGDEVLSVAGLSKTNLAGGQLALNWTESPTRFGGNGGPFALNPQNRNALEFSYTQPLLQGAGVRVNTAPIVIARLNTEVSFFQYKDSVQELVRSTIEGYWNLVQARIDEWAIGIQVEQSKEAYEREKARFGAKLADIRDVSQAQVSYTQFKARLVAAKALVLAREAALRNLLGLVPNDDREILPVSVPTFARVRPAWKGLTNLAEERRPDIIELKLILEAEQVRLLQAENQALPTIDAVALYRWNGLAGAMPNGERLATGPGQFTDWTAGINFSVPLGLRQGRAQVREEKLRILRDRANLEQGVHAAIHELAGSVRELDSNWEQYLAYKESRLAAFDNLKVQIEQFKSGRSIYLNVLQAINDWGNAVISESRTLLTYNIALASLERQTGTILETHGLVFFEERFRAAGPLGIFGPGRLYPSAIVPTGAPTQYPPTSGRSEDAFNLRSPSPRGPEPIRPQFAPPSPVDPEADRRIAPRP